MDRREFMITWLLFLKVINGKYEIVQAGANIVPTEEFDKVLPTTEKIARQFEKVFFDGKRLKVKDGETLLSIEELNYIRDENDKVNTGQQEKMKNIYDIEN